MTGGFKLLAALGSNHTKMMMMFMPILGFINMGSSTLSYGHMYFPASPVYTGADMTLYPGLSISLRDRR
jgi:hypothetical protein